MSRGALAAHLRPGDGTQGVVGAEDRLRASLSGVLACWVAIAAAGFALPANEVALCAPPRPIFPSDPPLDDMDAADLESVAKRYQEGIEVEHFGSSLSSAIPHFYT